MNIKWKRLNATFLLFSNYFTNCKWSTYTSRMDQEHTLSSPLPSPSSLHITNSSAPDNAMQCNVKAIALILRSGTWATTLFELLQERNVHVPRCDYALHLKLVLRMDHTFTHIHLTQNNVTWFNRLTTTTVPHHLHNLFLMEITLHYTMAIGLHWLVAIQSIAIPSYINHCSKCKKQPNRWNQMSSVKI
jgi:hypothetical protein